LQSKLYNQHHDSKRLLQKHGAVYRLVLFLSSDNAKYRKSLPCPSSCEVTEIILHGLIGTKQLG